MLILSTIGTSFSLLGMLFSIGDYIDNLDLSMGLAIFSSLSLVAMLVSIPALVLLWMKKNPLGIWMKLGSYALVFLASIGELFFIQPMVNNAVAELLSSDPSASRDAIELGVNVGAYAAYGVALISAIIMAILWWFAYKDQVKADQKA